jgi:hypothetical protein
MIEIDGSGADAGRRTCRLELIARDAEALQVADRLLEGRGTWEAVDGGWRFAGERKLTAEDHALERTARPAKAPTVATLESAFDPCEHTLDVTATVGNDPTVVAAVFGRTMRVRQARSVVHHTLRRASAEETVAAALCWILGWSSMIGHDTFVDAFWTARTEARVCVAADVPAWLANGAPLPIAGVERKLGIFVVYTGREVLLGGLEMILRTLEGMYPDTVPYGGVYLTETSPPGAIALIAVAELDDRPNLRRPERLPVNLATSTTATHKNSPSSEMDA